MRPITAKGGITGTDLPRVTGKVKIETNEQKKREHRKRKVSISTNYWSVLSRYSTREILVNCRKYHKLCSEETLSILEISAKDFKDIQIFQRLNRQNKEMHLKYVKVITQLLEELE